MTTQLPLENLLTPFMLEGGHVRGRVVRLGDAATTILSRYDYPAPVVHLLGELLVVAAMLAANLKQEGILTIQIKGKGLVPLVVVDAVYGGSLRGYAEVPEESIAAITALNAPSPRALVGEDSYLAITLDPGMGMQRYQGIVALDGETVAEALSSYFSQSQQIDAQVKLAVSTTQPRIAAGMLIERMPETVGASEPNRESWRYAQAIAATVTGAELLDPLLDAQTLLYRLFHEEGVWVYAATGLSVGCRCSRERIERMLLGMPPADRADMIVDGKASVHCQFCNKAEILRRWNWG